MIYHDGKEIGFIYKDGKKIDRIYHDGKLFFEQGFTREIHTAEMPVDFKSTQTSVKNYKISGNTVQNGTPSTETPAVIQAVGDYQEDIGKYAIPVVVQGENYSIPITLYLDAPLQSSDDIDYVRQTVTRKYAVRVFDGTETGWNVKESKWPEAYQCYLSISRWWENFGAKNAEDTLNTHFISVSNPGGTGIGENYNMYPLKTTEGLTDGTVTSWKSYLAAQYAAGTPVTVVYPLATPVTETIQFPKLPLFKGINFITVDTKIPPSDIYIQYKGN